MIKQLLNDLKSYNFLQKFKKDYYVDAKDDRQWKVARIINIRTIGTKLYVMIRFDGHSHQWNEEIELPPPTNKLAPFRRFSLPYTGSNMEINRDLGDINWDYHIKNINRIDNLLTIKPQLINQYYRGDLFIIVDYVLTTRTLFNEEELSSILTFLKSYILAGIKFLSEAQQNIEEIVSEVQSEPMLIYVSSKIASLFACIEFLFNFNSLVTKNEKRVRFLQNNDKGKNSQLEGLKNLVLSKQVYTLCEKIMNFRSKNGYGFPWNIKKEVFIFLQNFGKLEFPQIINNKEMSDALQYLAYLHKKLAITAECLDNKQIELVIGLITNGKFQQKKNGLNQLKFIIERASKFKQALIAQEIKRTKLLEHLINNQNFNSQLFKRSVPVFQFCAKQAMLHSDHLKLIIQLRKDKHELQLKSFYNSLSQFGRFLDQKTVVLFFSDITQLPIDQNMVNLVKEYTLSVTNFHPVFKKQYMQDIGYGVTYFFGIIDQNLLNLNDSLRNKTIESLAELLVNPYYSRHVQYFINQSFKSIKNKKNIDSHLKIIYEAMKICKGKKMYDVIESIEKEISIIDCVVRAVTEDATISQKALENMFQFLQQVNHVAKKSINAVHIKNFWMRKECRRYLLKFLRKHKTIRNEEKTTQRIIMKQLDCQTIKEICNSIFSSSEMMDNYTKIDIQTYQTIDELLISYNHRQDIIDYNYKHTLRVKKVQNLFGMHIYKQIIIKSQDLKIADKACERLIQYYLRPASRGILSSELTTKLNTWKQLVNILDELDHFLLKAYNFLLINIQGRMKSLNITEATPITIGVQLRDTIKQITLPRFSSLWKLRILISQQFKLQNTNFELSFAENNSKLTFQRQQDLSVAAIPITKQNLPAIIVTPSKQIHPHYQAIQQFKIFFSETKAETLFQMTAIQPPNVHAQILNILFQVPFIHSIQKSITKLDIQQNQWDRILDIKFRPKLRYQIKIINSLSLINNIKWISLFIQKKGVEHLSKILLERKENDDFQILSQVMLILSETIRVYRKTSQNLPFSEAFVKEILRVPPNNIYFSEYLLNTFKFILELTFFTTISMANVFKHPQIQVMMQIALFNKYMPDFPSLLYEISIKTTCVGSLYEILNNFLKYSYLKNRVENCRGFFDLLIILVDKTDCKSLMRNMAQCVQTIKKQKLMQKSQKQTNWLIEGYLRLLKSFDRKGNFQQIFGESRQNIYNELISEGLFIDVNKDYRFKSNETRKLCYNIIGQSKEGKRWVDRIGEIMVPIIKTGTWRKQFQWNVKAIEMNKNKLTGLKNLAATCYINSLFQQLYFIKSFRQRILGLNTSLITDKQNIAYEMQKIFAFLKYTQGLSYTTVSLCQNFLMDGNPINPRVQTDVDEFFHSLMDKLERNLKEVNQQVLINDIFGGQYANLIIGQECQHKSERIEHFLSMRLEIKDKNSLQEALDDFIKAEILEGDNAYFCERCNAKVRAQRRVCIKTLPNILILTLKRFQFDYQKMQKFKLNSFCSFPDQINMLPYTRQYLYQEGQDQTINFIYKLKGVIIHYGISQAGHYTSYINTTQGWNYFDDQNVEPFDISNLEDECFGGIELNPFGDDEQKRKNAYLLFYERVNVAVDQVKEIRPNSLIVKQVEEDNWKQKYIRILFDQGLQNFILKFASSSPKLVLLYFHLVVLRGSNKMYLGQFFRKCQDLVTSSKQVSKWYLEQMQEMVIQQFLIFAERDIRYLVGWLIICAVKNICDIEFYKRCLKCLCRKNILILNKIIKVGCNMYPECRKLLAQQNLAERALKLILDPNYTFPLNYSEKIRDFGRPLGSFNERRDNVEVISLLQSIQTLKLNIPFEEIETLVQKCKKSECRTSLAKLLAKKSKQMDGFMKIYSSFLYPKIMKFEPKIGEQYIYEFYLCLMKEMAELTDEHSSKKHEILVELYIQAIKQSFQGYMSMKILLTWLFKTSFSNLAFRDKVAQSFTNNKENKKIIKSIKEWIKQTQQLAYLLKSAKWGYWRNPKQYTNINLSDIDTTTKLDQWTSTLNSLIEKHNINYDQPKFTIDVGHVVLVDPLPQARHFNKVKGKIEGRLGWLLQVQAEDGSTRLFTEDQVIIT